MKGFVPTPQETVDTMVGLLFEGRPPEAGDTVLDPGCGTGEFIDGVIRWCKLRRRAIPRITGVESDPRHLPALRNTAGFDQDIDKVGRDLIKTKFSENKVDVKVSFKDSPAAPAPATLLNHSDCDRFYPQDEDAAGAADCGNDMLLTYAAAYRQQTNQQDARRILLVVTPSYGDPLVTLHNPGDTYRHSDESKEMSFVFLDQVYSLAESSAFDATYMKRKWLGLSGAHELGHQIGVYPHLTHANYSESGIVGDNIYHYWPDRINGHCLMEWYITDTEVYQGLIHFCDAPEGSIFSDACSYRLRQKTGLPGPR